MAKRLQKIEISVLVARANNTLANPKISQGEKKGVCCLLEEVLMATKTYRGFNYVHWLAGGCKEWLACVELGTVKEDDFNTKQKYLGEEYSRMYYSR